ncbi:hypothetical protein A8950_1092 [Dongia mobilis]|uniref:Uncharacterized protein n=1 Tax=Dongia mobilis TaxID=578943 RepID=A0A4R6WSF2_9PROT|nr:hypothetical protein [Dongia mobilis]TDQ84535.1 hypothetical protein A8950_1092 [Dongia mobilis]
MPAPDAPAPAGAALPGAAAPIPGDLGSDLWMGSEVSRLMTLMPRLPSPVTIPGLRDLQVRLLASNAPSAAASTGIDPLQPIRADKLYQMGFGDLAMAIVQGNVAAAAAASDPLEVVARAVTERNDAAACQQVDAVLAGGQALDGFFQRAVIYCQIVRDQGDAASLGLGLLRETGGGDAVTRDFIALAALANGETKRQPKLAAEPDALNQGLMRRVGMAVPGEGVQAGGRLGPLAIARDPARPLPERVAAAEQAHRNGLLPAAELAELYLQMPAGNADPATAIAISDSVETRAQLYQQARRSMQPAATAKAIQAALRQARQRGDYLNQAELYAALADAISPNRDLASFAPEAARLMFLSGKPDKGGYWLNTVAANPNAFARPGEREGLELLGRIAGLAGSSAADPIAAWRQASGTADGRVDLIYALLSGTGQPVTGEVAGGFAASPVVQVGSASTEIAAAAAGNRKGEAIILALTALKGDQVLTADPAVVDTSLRSLSAIGQAAEARRIAREIAVLAGL